MNVKTLVKELDLEKEKFNAAKNKIENLRLKIALELCPIKIGERVKYVKNGKKYEGIVEYIHYATDLMDSLNPKPGTLTGWSAGGHRINKTTNEVGKIEFSIVSFDATLKADIWEVTEKTIEQLFGT